MQEMPALFRPGDTVAAISYTPASPTWLTVIPLAVAALVTGISPVTAFIPAVGFLELFDAVLQTLDFLGI